ncbi:hypothetical protein FQN50_009338 [Emmonsiellopsis sp. PD_5]|nr:hypothetical protein FQN50_009338 [Emmonsiellopsis sp. PD_5]
MHGMDCSLAQSHDAIALDNGNLQISFHRTIRVPDIDTPFHLPPHLGRFPLYTVKQFDQRLPEHIVSNGGFFFLIHDKEALWIRFTTDRQFAVRISAGGVNVVSGLAANNRPSALCREKQDYIITPDQLWIDGFATAPNTARQFVAVASENGYSVDAQLTSEEVVGGFQFQVIKTMASVLVTYSVSGCSKTMTVDHQDGVPQFLEQFIKEFGLTDDGSSLRLRGIPYNISSLRAGGIFPGRNNSITVEPLIKDAQGPKLITLYTKSLTGKQYTVEVDRNASIQDLRSVVSESTGWPVKDIRLCHPPQGSLEDRGKITQPIAKAYYIPTTQAPTTTTSFSVHMLNASTPAVIEDMLSVGIRAIPRAIDATTYLEQGGALFDVYCGYEGVKADGGEVEVGMEAGSRDDDGRYPSCWREYKVLWLDRKPERGGRGFVVGLGRGRLVEVREGDERDPERVGGGEEYVMR